MKKQILSTLMTLSAAALLLTSCAASDKAESVPEEIPAETENISAETDKEETETLPEETSPTEENSSQDTEKMTFTVDITDNLAADMALVIGNTATEQSYCGIIEIHLDDTLSERAAREIRTGKTYIFTVEPMMTMSIPPQVTATDFTPADEEDINRLEEVRKAVSNYSECMDSYQSMSLEQIIQDANLNYALWTQDEILEFTQFIAEKGYTDDSEIKSYVKIRDELNGSISGFSEE